MGEGTGPAMPAPPPVERPRVLRRSSTDKVIAGVAGGLGRYLGVDPVLIRIAFVLLALAGGGGFLLYVLGWILIPEEKEGEDVGSAPPSSADSVRLLVGAVLIAVGTVLLLDLAVPRIGKYLWPVAIIAVGVVIVVQASRKR